MPVLAKILKRPAWLEIYILIAFPACVTFNQMGNNVGCITHACKICPSRSVKMVFSAQIIHTDFLARVTGIFKPKILFHRNGKLNVIIISQIKYPCFVGYYTSIPVFTTFDLHQANLNLVAILFFLLIGWSKTQNSAWKHLQSYSTYLTYVLKLCSLLSVKKLVHKFYQIQCMCRLKPRC